MSSKYESFPSRPWEPGYPSKEFRQKSKAVNDKLLPTDETESPEATRDRIMQGFRIGDPDMPFTYEIASALGRATRQIGLGHARVPKRPERHPRKLG